MTAPTFLLIVGGPHDGETIARESVNSPGGIAIDFRPAVTQRVSDVKAGDVVERAPKSYATYRRRKFVQDDGRFFMECAAPVEMSDKEVLALIFSRKLHTKLAQEIEDKTGANG